MNWAWASSLDHIWRSPTFPMWLTLAAAGFFGLIVLITLLRAEKSVANGALTVITLLAVGIAVAATIRGFGPEGRGASPQPRSYQQVSATLPALSCIDDLAGEAVLVACEKTLFGSAESAAAGVAYAASQIARLTSLGDVASANKSMTSELAALRRSVERDRYGLMAYVLMARDHCTPSVCVPFRSLTDSRQVAVNMNERLYENLIMRYASSWNAPATGSAGGAMAALPPLAATGKPTSAEFPTSASTPPVNIMTPEPGSAPASSAPRAPAAATAPPAAGKKQAAAPKRPPVAAPVQLAPAAQAPDNSND